MTCNFFAGMSSDLTGRPDSAKKDRLIAARPPNVIRGIFAMSSDHQISFQPGEATERKPWETPTVIVGSAQRETLSNLNTGIPDGIASTGSSYGS
jgi:hypothetical protein